MACPLAGAALSLGLNSVSMGKNIADGNYRGAAIDGVFGALDLFTLGTSSAVLPAAQKVSKEAAIQYTKETVKEASKNFGKEGSKKIAKEGLKGAAKQIVVEGARQSTKEFKMKAGNELAKLLAQGMTGRTAWKAMMDILSTSGKDVVEEASKAMVIDGGKAATKEFVEKLLIYSGQKFMSDVGKQTAKTGAEIAAETAVKGAFKVASGQIASAGNVAFAAKLLLEKLKP